MRSHRAITDKEDRMFRSTHTIKRLAAGLAVAAAMATLVVPTALAGGNSGYRDGWYGWAVALTKQQHAKTSIDGRSPDSPARHCSSSWRFF